MSDSRPAPASAAEAGPDRHQVDRPDDGDGDAERDASEEAPPERSDLRTATRLLRLVKVALGALVSALTALRLLGLLALGN
jgi:hypothetical protein